MYPSTKGPYEEIKMFHLKATTQYHDGVLQCVNAL